MRNGNLLISELKTVLQDFGRMYPSAEVEVESYEDGYWEYWDAVEELYSHIDSFIGATAHFNAAEAEEVSEVCDIIAALPPFEKNHRERALCSLLVSFSGGDCLREHAVVMVKACMEDAFIWDRCAESGYQPIYRYAPALMEKYGIRPEDDIEGFTDFFVRLVKSRHSQYEMVIWWASLCPQVTEDPRVKECVRGVLLRGMDRSGGAPSYAVRLLEGLNISPSQELLNQIKRSMLFCFLYDFSPDFPQSMPTIAEYRRYTSEKFGISPRDPQVYPAVVAVYEFHKKNPYLHSPQAVAFLESEGLV